MEDLVIVKASDVAAAFNRLFEEVHHLRNEIDELRNKEEELKAYTTEETAKLIGFHPKTIRKMIRRKILEAVHAVSGRGEYRITAASIKSYLEKKNQKNTNPKKSPK